MWEQLMKVVSGGIFGGVAEVIRTFVTDPTERVKAELALQTLQVETQRELMRLEVADRESARKREASVQGYTMPTLTALYTAGYFGMMFGLLSGWFVIPTDEAGMFQALVGVLTAGQYSIMAYYYGSSAGSSVKTRLLANGNGGGEGR